MAEQIRPSFASQLGHSLAQSFSQHAGTDASSFLGIRPQKITPEKIEQERRKRIIDGINRRNVMFVLDEVERRAGIRRNLEQSEEAPEIVINKKLNSGVDDPISVPGGDPISQQMDEFTEGQTNSTIDDFIASGAEISEKASPTAKAVSKAIVAPKPEPQKKLTSIAKGNAEKFALDDETRRQVSALDKDVTFNQVFDEAEAGAQIATQLNDNKARLKKLFREGELSFAATMKLAAAMNENREDTMEKTMKWADTYFTKGGGKQYIAMFRSFNAAEAAYARATEAQRVGGRPGPSDYMLMFSFIKNLDDSVVRESEIRGFQGTIALADRLKVKVQGALETGQILDQETRNEIISLMRTAMTVQADMQKSRWDLYRKSAESMGLNPDIVVSGMTERMFNVGEVVPIKTEFRSESKAQEEARKRLERRGDILPLPTVSDEDYNKAIEALREGERERAKGAGK